MRNSGSYTPLLWRVSRLADQSLIRPVRAKPRSAPTKAPVYLRGVRICRCKIRMGRMKGWEEGVEGGLHVSCFHLSEPKRWAEHNRCKRNTDEDREAD
jgi:hypothetical protein